MLRPRNQRAQRTESRQPKAFWIIGTACSIGMIGVTSKSKNSTHGAMPSMMASGLSLSMIDIPPLPSPRA
ncbi:MAG: hypothetical protein M3198_13405 [Actinomycetota bacterium]|nr:hypothetical protein [Actinomycetota bacterium]